MIKHLALFLIFLLAGLTFSATAQFSNLIIFTQANEPFRVILNGIQQNPAAETNVKITGLKAPSYKVKIVFENQAMTEINKTVYLQPETETTNEILKNNKGVWVLRMLNSIPVDEAPVTVANQDVYEYTLTPRISTTTIGQTTTVSAGGFGGGVSVTTTTTQSNGYTGSQGVQGNANTVNYNDDADRAEYAGPRGCPRPMSQHAFEEAKESVSSKSFASSKLTIAKQIVSANCLKCRQVKEIMQLFTFESDKVEFAKYAYKYTWDINNYFLLNDAFEFESSIDELNRFINKK